MTDHQLQRQVSSISLINFWERALGCRKYAAGIILTLLLALCVKLIADITNAPSMLLAMIVGLCGHFVFRSNAFVAGVEVSAKQLLRLGVALLGAKIVLVDVMALGWPVILLVIAGVIFTLVSGLFVGRLFGLKSDHAILSAGSVAICGASAALAVSSVLGQDRDSERRTTITIIGVTTLSTIVMILYPIVTRLMGYDDQNAGLFIGATIHDVAQVMGAGYMVSEEAGQTAAIVKLTRVVCLVPAVFIIGYFYCRSQQNHSECTDALETKVKQPFLPGFLIAFLCLMAFNSAGALPQSVTSGLGELSGFLLLVAVTALGLKTSFKDIMSIGIKPVLVLSVQTILLALFALAGISFLLPYFS
ncbi:YeiH family protein [Kordiimonas sp. SCSIO 12610]|uniref:YeiH family protein n=1 Tax=Kordiimonas sp. SCSIO 12610 TaxID=2829597 RepID=UPI00210BD777|nr:putative sulfate exporter family transporter [Kordiimonas sp. SCSIO 12610]UTW55850.1 putative sulfate exporter family transporter [Kordiimonas sp. SCSIO 12610]